MQNPIERIDFLIHSLDNYTAQMEHDQHATDSQAPPNGDVPEVDALEPLNKKQKSVSEKEVETKMEIDDDGDPNMPPLQGLNLSNKTDRNPIAMPSPRPRRASSLRSLSDTLSEEADLNSSSALNEMEVYGWGNIDPLLYATRSSSATSTVSVDTDNDIKMSADGNMDIAETMEEDFGEDEVIKPRCLIPVKSMKFNFNDLIANFNGATVWRRDANGTWGWGDNEDGAIGDGIESQIKEPRPIHKMRDRPVRFVSIGERHTAVIVKYGGVYVFGSNENVRICEIPSICSFYIFCLFVVPFDILFRISICFESLCFLSLNHRVNAD